MLIDKEELVLFKPKKVTGIFSSFFLLYSKKDLSLFETFDCSSEFNYEIGNIELSDENEDFSDWSFSLRSFFSFYLVCSIEENDLKFIKLLV